MTRTNLLNSILIVCLIFFSNINSIRVSTNTSVQDALANGGYANMCLSALTESMNPGFCWKRGADAGVIPTGCPKGYFRSLALCYQECAPGWTHILGICYKNCDAGYINHGLTCYKSFFRWYFKKSYIPKSLTNFSSEVPCPGDMYRSGALCYRDCRLIGMENCGIGACIAEGASCTMKILEMTAKVLEGVGTGVTTVLSLGSSIPAKTSAKTMVKAAVKKLSRDAINAALKAAKTALTGKFKKIILNRAAKKARDTLKDLLKEKFKETMITSICSAVWEGVAKKDFKAPTVEDLGSKVIDTLDVFGVGNVVKSCSNTQSDGGFGCGKAIVDSMSAFDPSGLLTIASAFMHPTCDVPVNKPAVEPIADIEANTSAQLSRLTSRAPIPVPPPRCIWIYNQINYQGERLEVCGNLNFLNNQFNDKVSSFVVGSNIDGFFFEHANFGGLYLRFMRGVSVINTKNHGNVDLSNKISSIYFGSDDFMSIAFKTSAATLFFKDSKNEIRPKAPKNQINTVSLFLNTGKRARCAFSANEDGRNPVIRVYEQTTMINPNDYPQTHLFSCQLI